MDVKAVDYHCVKSVQIRSYFWSVFSYLHLRIKMRTRNNSVFGHFSRTVLSHKNTHHRCLTGFTPLKVVKYHKIKSVCLENNGLQKSFSMFLTINFNVFIDSKEPRKLVKHFMTIRITTLVHSLLLYDSYV